MEIVKETLLASVRSGYSKQLQSSSFNQPCAHEVLDNDVMGQCSSGDDDESDDDCTQLVTPSMHTATQLTRHMNGRSVNEVCVAIYQHIICSTENILWYPWPQIDISDLATVDVSVNISDTDLMQLIVNETNNSYINLAWAMFNVSLFMQGIKKNWKISMWMKTQTKHQQFL